MAFLELKNLTKEYTRGRSDFKAVNAVNLRIDEGDYINIIGRSGSGKTTLLNLMSGMVSPSEGEVLIEGESLFAKDDEGLSRIRNEKIGYIPQGISTLPNLNVLDNIVLPFFLNKREGDVYGRARNLLKLLNIRDLEYAYPKELSGGELRRVLIARSLINQPKILMADEATADLDVHNTAEVMELFKRINEDEGVALVLVSHELDLLSYGKSIYTMDGGILNPGNILTSPQGIGTSSPLK